MLKNRSFVGKKKNQRWLWLAIDHSTRKIIAFAFGRRIQTVFRKLKKLPKPFDIRRYYSDAFPCYYKLLPKKQHTVGKSNTQRIERKNLTLRTRIKRLARRTICFSKTIEMHDIVIGLVINILDFALFFANHFHAFLYMTEKKVFPHNLRRHFAIRFYSKAKDLSKLADVLGHANINTTRIYLKGSGAEHRRIINSLGLVKYSFVT